jgi:hypothetical protein
MSGTKVLNQATSFVANVPTNWSIAETGDFNADGKTDILWRDSSGNTTIWLMITAAVSSASNLGNIPTDWTVQSVNAE